MFPGAERAVIDPAKVRDYLLSATHPVGRFKAVVFHALGYTPQRWEQLRDDLLALALNGAAASGPTSPFGQKYEVIGTLPAAERSSGPVRLGLATPAGRRSPEVHHCVPGMSMHNLLDSVALTQDLPNAALRKGDVGAVVEVLGPAVYEVEFVAASGRTQALVMVTDSQIRALGDQDLLSVRSLAEAGA